jgi:hypothetical protein
MKVTAKDTTSKIKATAKADPFRDDKQKIQWQRQKQIPSGMTNQKYNGNGESKDNGLRAGRRLYIPIHRKVRDGWEPCICSQCVDKSPSRPKFHEMAVEGKSGLELNLCHCCLYICTRVTIWCYCVSPW